MDKSSSNIKFGMIFIGIIIGFLLAVLIFNSQSSDKKEVLKNQNKENCSILKNELHIISQKLLNESASLDDTKIDCKANGNATKVNGSFGFLSPRIYSGILEPRSFLITNFEPLKSGIDSFLQQQNINASVYVENLRNGISFGINENAGYFPASLNKLPIAIIVMQKIEDGKLSLDSMLPVKDYEKTDSYGTLYLTKEKQLSVRFLLEKMLKESDNTAFNVLYDNIDRNELAQLLDYFHLKENLEYPLKRLEYENNKDLVTPIQLYNIFSSLYLSTVLYGPDSEYILSLLTKTTNFDVNAAANLPDNVTIADKFGEYYIDDTKLFHDCGIMYIDHSRFFYCIMIQSVEVEDARQYIGYIVNYIYNYITDTRTKLSAFRKPSSIVKATNN